MAIIVWLRLQEPDLYRNGSFVTMCSGVVLENNNIQRNKCTAFNTVNTIQFLN